MKFIKKLYLFLVFSIFLMFVSLPISLFASDPFGLQYSGNNVVGSIWGETLTFIPFSSSEPGYFYKAVPASYDTSTNTGRYYVLTVPDQGGKTGTVRTHVMDHNMEKMLYSNTSVAIAGTAPATGSSSGSGSTSSGSASGKLYTNSEPSVTGPRIGTSGTSKPVEEIAIDIVTNVFLPIIGGIALLFVIYGGVMVIISRGDPEKLAKAKKTLLWAVIGIIIVVLSYGLVVSLSKIIERTV